MRGAGGIDFLTGVAQLDTQPGEHSYVPYVLPTVDAHRAGLFPQRLRSAAIQCDFTSVAAGRTDGQIVVRPAKGTAIRIMRAQAFVLDLAAPAVDWVTNGERTVTKIALGHGTTGPYSVSDIDLERIEHVNTSATPVESPPLVKASPMVYDLDELASGTTRITYEPPTGLVLARPLDADDDRESTNGIWAAFSRVAGGIGENDRLYLHLVYTACNYGAFPPL